MVRALAIAAALAGVIVACSFKGQPAGLGDDGMGPHDAAIEDGAVIHGDGPIVDASPNPAPDAAIDAHPVDAMIDAHPVDAMPDAMADASGGCTMGACSAAGGSCNASNVCVIAVGAGNNSAITCATDMACEVDCNSDGVCQHGVSCGLATSCTIECTANNTCSGTNLLCSASPCRVDCVGINSCDNSSLTGEGSSSCHRHCCGGGSCQGSDVISSCASSNGGC